MSGSKTDLLDVVNPKLKDADLEDRKLSSRKEPMVKRSPAKSQNTKNGSGKAKEQPPNYSMPFYCTAEIQNLPPEDRSLWIYVIHKIMNKEPYQVVEEVSASQGTKRKLLRNEKSTRKDALADCDDVIPPSPPEQAAKRKLFSSEGNTSRDSKVSAPQDNDDEIDWLPASHECGAKRKLSTNEKSTPNKVSRLSTGRKTYLKSRFERSLDKMKEDIEKKEVEQSKVDKFFKNLPEPDDDDINLDCDFMPKEKPFASNKRLKTDTKVSNKMKKTGEDSVVNRFFNKIRDEDNSDFQRLKRDFNDMDSRPSSSKQKEVLEDVVDCPICGLQFPPSEIEQHAATCGEIPEDDAQDFQLTCDRCHTRFDLCTDYTAHLRTCI